MRIFGYSLVVFSFVWLYSILSIANGQLSNLRLRQSTTCGRLQVIRGDARTLSPWTAAIFVKNGNTKRFFTNGIIIGPTTVLSVAGGPFGETLRASKNPEYSIPNPGTFLIVAGINSTDFDAFDEFAQTSQISVVEPHRGHDFGNEHYHYFIYHLKTPLNFETPYVKDICLPLFLMTTNQSPYGLKIVQSGFALSAKANEAQILKVWPIISGNKESCESVFRYHYKRDLETSRAFCGRKDWSNTTHWATGYLNNRQAEGVEDNRYCHLHGASLIFNIPDIWYLGSLVTAIPGRSKGRCSYKSYYIYGDILRHLAWMHRSYRCSPNKFACTDSTCIPWSSVCNGIENCKGGEDEDKKYCSAQSRCFNESIKKNTTHSCGLGGRCISKFQVCDGKTDCEDGSDEAEALCNPPLSVKPQRRRKSNCVTAPDIQGAVKTCFDPEAKNEDLDCNQATFPGAKVSYKCTKFTTSHYTYDDLYMECDPEGSGEWLGRKPFSCDPDCGVWTDKSMEQYLGLPWFVHVRAYIQGVRRLICSGTLIESRFILTSAKCIGPYLTKDIADFLINTQPSSTNPKSETYNRNLTDFFSTKNIFFSDGTVQRTKNSNGLTIIQLADPVVINQDDKPVPACYNLPPFKKPGYGKIGIVTGFGVGEISNRDDRPSVTKGVVVPESECEQAGITVTDRTKFCVIFNEGQGICKEDAGGGIYFEEKIGDKKQYVLRGVAEPMDAELCARTNYALFTNVNSYSDWLLDVLESNS